VLGLGLTIHPAQARGPTGAAAAALVPPIARSSAAAVTATASRDSPDTTVSYRNGRA
jgi:hypothetical protein